ncbi:MAG: hypothetical protein WA863_12440, partial [Methyloceanibacter sp.]
VKQIASLYVPAQRDEICIGMSAGGSAIETAALVAAMPTQSPSLRKTEAHMASLVECGHTPYLTFDLFW